LNTLKFKAEVAYDSPSNYQVSFNTDNAGELLPLYQDLEVDSNFKLEITNFSVVTNKDRTRLYIIFNGKATLSESLENNEERIKDLKKRLQGIFEEIGENFHLALQLKHEQLPLILKRVWISLSDNSEEKTTIPSKDKKNNNELLDKIAALDPIIADAISSTLDKKESISIIQDEIKLEQDSLIDVVKKTINLTKLKDNYKELLHLLKRIIKWYYRALDDSDDTDKFIDYFMILEVWKLYKARKENDKECIPAQENRIPHKDCLLKAIEKLCKEVFSKWNIEFDEFYRARNEVIHEGLEEKASNYLRVTADCAEKIIKELPKEIENVLKSNQRYKQS